MQRQYKLDRAGERRVPGQQFVQDDPQRVLVRRRGPLALRPAGRFRGEVRRSADDRPGDGQPVLVLGPAGQPEVEQVRVACRVQNDVRGFHVAVDHALAVRVGERVGQLLGYRGRFRRGEPPAFAALLDRVVEVHPGDEHRGQVQVPVRLAGLEQRYDVRVPQPGRGLGFPAEPDPPFWGLAHAPGQLQGHLALELRVVGPVDHAERPAAEEPADEEPPHPVRQRVGRVVGAGNGRIHGRRVVGPGHGATVRVVFVGHGRPRD